MIATWLLDGLRIVDGNLVSFNPLYAQRADADGAWRRWQASMYQLWIRRAVAGAARTIRLRLHDADGALAGIRVQPRSVAWQPSTAGGESILRGSAGIDAILDILPAGDG
ncbi:MAG: hypothetical protein ACOCXJ_08100 [Planctomycetota bacterium]